VTDFVKSLAPIDRRHFLGITGALAVALPFSGRAGAAARRAKILIVSTNVGKVGDSISGTFLMEIAYPFKYFVEAGLDVDVLTPKGGKAEVYHAGEEEQLLNHIRSSPAFIAKTRHSLAPDQVRPEDYLGIYYPGGHGQFWDVVGDARIAAIAAAIHERGGIVGAAGHGMASLTNIRLRDGGYFVDGKRMTAFPWWAEKKYMTVSNHGALLPFDMEAVLRERGATVIVPTEEQRRERSLTLIVDEQNRVVTGTWATLAQPVAQEMLRLSRQEVPSGRNG
jgi:putative intracellular protease/amidase